MSKAPKERGRAWVTGASSGIGQAFAHALARRGYDSVLVARREPRLRELATELQETYGGATDVRVADLADMRQVESLAQEIEADGRAEFLVNNAGLLISGDFASGAWEREHEAIAVMVESVTRLTRSAVTSMRPRGRGAIVQVSSIAALRPHADMATYSGCKAFVNGLSLALKGELAGSGLRLVTVCPGATRTELFERAGLKSPPTAGSLEPETVAEQALASLQRGELICMPGEGRRDRWLRRLVPRGLRPKLSGVSLRLLRP